MRNLFGTNKLSMIVRAGLAALLLGAISVASTATALAQTLSELRERGSVNIGMLVDYPPFGVLDASGTPIGYDADVIALISDGLGLPANIVPVTGPNRIPYLQTGQVDLLVATLAITEERSKQVAFSNPYAGLDMVVFARSDLSIDGPDALEGHRIGVARGSTQDIAVTQQAPSTATIQRFDDDATTIQALLSGQVDGIGIGYLATQEIQKIAPQGAYDVKFSLFQQIQGVAMRLGQDELLEAVNAIIATATDNGTLNEIHIKWLGSPLPVFPQQ